jgi:hypothetical protein
MSRGSQPIELPLGDKKKYINCVQSTMCDIFIKPRYHFLYLFKPYGAHHKMYKTTWVYIEKKNCVWVTNSWSFFGLYQLATQIILCFQLLHKTDCVCVCFLFIYLFLWRVQFLSYRLFLVQNRHTKYCLSTKYHLWYNYKNKVSFPVLIKTTWGTSWNL